MNDEDENKISSERKQGNFAKIENKLKGTIKCAAGYNFGTKLKTAFTICFNIYSSDLFHAWDRSKTNNFLQILKDCNPTKKILEWLHQEYSADICVLKKIDWLDDNLSLLNATIYQDLRNVLNSLPQVSVKFIKIRCIIIRKLGLNF